jgi:type III restriction enzyme
VKWVRPPLDQLPIFYRGRYYNVDFVVETATTKFLIEVKARKSLNEGDVEEKAKSAIRWCEIASGVEKSKKWEYRLIPDDAVRRTSDFHFIIGQAVNVA